MDADELRAVRERLEDFAADVFESLSRRDQRDKGATYSRGLLLDGRRKSMQPMAERLGVDHQGLQQFVSSSTWDVAPVRARLAQRATDVVAPDAWVIDDTGFPKDGTASPGVARQYSGTLGKVGNCQIAVSVHAATDTASAPLDWRLFLPTKWDPAHVSDGADEDAAAAAAEQVRARRRRAGIPQDVAHKPKWQLALDTIDELAGWGHKPPVVCADAGLMIGTATTATSATAWPPEACPTSPRSRTTSPPTPSTLSPRRSPTPVSARTRYRAIAAVRSRCTSTSPRPPLTPAAGSR